MKDQVMSAEVENVNNVPFEEFNAATSEWKGVSIANSGMLGNVILPNHFEIPLVDLVELLEEIGNDKYDKSVGVRAFIGLSNYGEYNGIANTSEMKLFLTGVNKLGDPIYHFNNHSAIYDFITPCPPTCVREGGISSE